LKPAKLRTTRRKIVSDDDTKLGEERAIMSEEAKTKLLGEAVSDDPFDLAKLRLPQDFLAESPVKKLLTTVPVRRPGPQDFIRVHPSVAYRHLMAMLKIEDDRDEIYAVDLNAVPELRNECYAANLFTAITRTGVVFLWPVRVPAADGRVNEWHVSAATAANAAMRDWIRMKSNMSLRAYEIFLAEKKNSIPDPTWPEQSLGELLRIAFRDRLVNSIDHPAVKRLRGA
jgi:hypothetical protein